VVTAHDSAGPGDEHRSRTRGCNGRSRPSMRNGPPWIESRGTTPQTKVASKAVQTSLAFAGAKKGCKAAVEVVKGHRSHRVLG
jgi:hypothetical protein